jgi:hypothetical protein
MEEWPQMAFLVLAVAWIELSNRMSLINFVLNPIYIQHEARCGNNSTECNAIQFPEKLP